MKFSSNTVTKNINNLMKNRGGENKSTDVDNKNTDKSMIRFNKLLAKLSNVNNDKVDAVRLVCMYVESSGRDINLPQLVSFLKK